MIRIFLILVLFLIHCSEFSREGQIREECEKTRNNSYIFMLPILERHTTNGNTELNSTVWITNTELSYKKCISESEKNRYNLRSN
ncbi:hypothetical protein [Leptospira kanakyensis]|uniref:Uncharacterized protein n=1 Tax=Leptospira kanakyensis TaxID=2484968 RepID=A0A6N4QJT8_9LEPT|nr:hypothetical protein [Leptospira kanakyensis]MCW7482911.1 hypothetical protein [Leptospira kanakyensis]TGK54420.1 hypothetical protein EHQ11_02375 [Leptospira kanakyensis]TGK59112.1 hypothetical protein EHQ16_12240 [Leptospira kanakyensis]TGK75262.1 hypothetical protein EHQ18_02915 [Leptospira kanakyensis]